MFSKVRGTVAGLLTMLQMRDILVIRLGTKKVLVFEKCITGELRRKSRVLITNQLQFLLQVDRTIVVHEDTVKEEGTFEELSNNGELFPKLMENAGKMEECSEEKEDVKTTDHSVASKPVANETHNDVSDNANGKSEPEGGKYVLIKQEERETSGQFGCLSEVYGCLRRSEGGSYSLLMLHPD